MGWVASGSGWNREVEFCESVEAKRARGLRTRSTNWQGGVQIWPVSRLAIKTVGY